VCYEPDAVPPIEPIEGAATRQHRLTLTASDGNQFHAFEAFADEPSDTGVVVLPDVRGLHHFYEELTVRLAEAGHDALAIDYFGRSAGLTGRGEDFPYQDHVPKVTWTGLTADVTAAAARLREPNPDRKLFTMGFCFGGSNSWQQAAAGHGLTGAIGFYGHASRLRPEGARPAIELVDQMEGAILALMAGDDPGIPPEVTEAFEDALTEAGVPHQVVTYPGAPHSFFDRRYQEFAKESADAWSRVLGFISDPPRDM
jgi:carboxymethylenebutenolidase